MTSNYRDQLKGREQALYDALQAVLRAHGYDDTTGAVVTGMLTQALRYDEHNSFADYMDRQQEEEEDD